MNYHGYHAVSIVTKNERLYFIEFGGNKKVNVTKNKNFAKGFTYEEAISVTKRLKKELVGYNSVYTLQLSKIY